MNPYYWKTEEPHSTNIDTMNDYLDNEMPEGWVIADIDGTYAEVVDTDGNKWAVHASGNGDCNNHKVEFELIGK